MKIMVLNGPNLNMLGTREPGIYGVATLQQIESDLKDTINNSKYELEFYQSNHEGNIIDKIQGALDNEVKFIIINPAAYTHTSVAIRDALLATKIPFIEVHLSNVHAREPFRHHSYLSDVATGVICGLGAYGYIAAMTYAIKYLQQQEGR